MLKSWIIALGVGISATNVYADCRFTIQFPYGSDEISIRDRLMLQDLAKSHSRGPVLITSHADDDGTDPQNMQLAQDRADAVRTHMQRAGLQSGAVEQTTIVAAKWDIVPTSASSVLNRRVEVFIGECQTENHIEARIYHTPGTRFRENGRVRMTSPKPANN